MILGHSLSLRHIIWDVPLFVKMDLSEGKNQGTSVRKKSARIWLFLRNTQKERGNPSSITVVQQNSISSQPGRPSTCLGDEPCSKAWRSIPLAPTVKHRLTPSWITSSSTAFAELAHLHPQNNREINGDDCNSQSLVSAAVERSNKLRLWILGRDLKLAL